MAASFRGRNTAKSSDELKKARETRATEALAMKDEQLRILSEQNGKLLVSLDKVEEEANTIQMEKLAVEQENRTLRDNNFELQSKARAAETSAKRMQAEVADKEKQLRIMTDQNSELLRLLESEEGLSAQLQNEVAELRAELDELRQKHGALLTTAKTHEEMSTKAAREGQLRAEEIRLLRTETEQLKQQNAELKMKTQVEVEALQEQLRVRKEKQYQLLEKLQAQEEAKRQAEDQVTGMEEQLRGLHAKNVDLETQLQLEIRIKQNLEESNKDLLLTNGNLQSHNSDLQIKIEKSERERLRMEAEARDSGDQLREMAEKVFQLLERLKLAELGKTKAMEALKKKEQDMVALQKKNARLIKESTEEGRARVKAELDVKVLQDQVRTHKKQNAQLAQKSKEEAAEKVKAMEDVAQMIEKVRATESRLSFLLNKVQTDEETRVVLTEDRKKLEAQVMTLSDKAEELHHKLAETSESNRMITQAMRLKQEELNTITIKYEALMKEQETRDANEDPSGGGGGSFNMSGAKPGGPDDIENVRLNEGRGRFYVEAKTVGGGSLLLLRGRKPLYRDWIDRHGANEFLKRAQKTTRFRDLSVEKLAQMYGLLMVEEEEKTRLLDELQGRDRQIEHLQKKLTYVQDGLATEEDAKRRMLLRYIHAVKEHAMVSTDGVGGVLQLPESNISDEEVHALSALLRNNLSIDEINLRGNNITDDGARALAAVLSGKSSLKLVDLRGNKIGKSTIRVLAEALERSERVRHVYVHGGGKIEALGTGKWANPRGGGADNTGGTGFVGGQDPKMMVTVETVCVVDVRDNEPEPATAVQQSSSMASTAFHSSASEGQLPGGGNGSSSYTPAAQLQSLAPPRSAGRGAAGGRPAGVPQASSTSPEKTRKKKSKKHIQSLRSLNRESDAGEESDTDRRKSQPRKKREDYETAVKEAAWVGRAGGMDSFGMSLDEEGMRRRKHGELPPLSADGAEGSVAFDGSPQNRIKSAPNTANRAVSPSFRGPGAGASSDEEIDANDPNQIVKAALRKANGGKKRKPSKTSNVENKLYLSPFAKPVLAKTDGNQKH